MHVAIAGAHGQIALRLTRLLADEGNQVIGLVRNPDHFAEVSRAGGSPVLCDLEQATVAEVGGAIGGAEAIVFAAGAGPGSGAARKLTVDRDGAIKLLDAATSIGVPRYVILSAVGAENPPSGNEVYDVYLQAKAQADAAVMASDREWTIVRPGGLTDDPGTGEVRIDSAPFRGSVPRDDVASLLALLVADVRSARRILYVNAGEQPLGEALEELLSAPSATRA
jgi:nucleoside-diphosphate-sugar epimerase